MNAQNAEIVSVGTELLQGGRVDRNSVFLTEMLHGIGIEVSYRTTVGDDRRRIRDVLRQALDRVAVVVVTGGLGPTADDRTRDALGDVSGRPLVLHGETLRAIEERFARRGVPIPELVKRQAWVPESFVVMRNRHGTAPGLLWETGEGFLVALPGPPREMQPLFTEQVLPVLLKGARSERRIRTRTMRICGLREAQVEERIIDLLRGDHPPVSILARPGEVHVRITIAGTEEEVKSQLELWEAKLRDRLGDPVFGVDEERLEEAVGRLLRTQGKTVAVAESCTGGLVAHRITNIPGSSDYFERGVVSYSNRAKVELLGVPVSLIEQHGAVSPEVAAAMAAGVRHLAGTDLGIGLTGIAGPGGGTEAKPVGLTYIALADAHGEEWCEYRFQLDREENKVWATQTALEMLRQYLLKTSAG
ncbi:MAG: competence/damage-inducible protein A, partial [Candidatus Methylomirabilales bacterium]